MLAKVLVVKGFSECVMALSLDSLIDPGCTMDAPLGLPPPVSWGEVPPSLKGAAPSAGVVHCVMASDT